MTTFTKEDREAVERAMTTDSPKYPAFHTGPTAMVIKAAKVLSQRQAEACGVDSEDNWKMYGNDFIGDAQAMLEVVGASELLEALHLLLDQVDYTKGACGMAEMVGACLDARFIDQARNVIARVEL